MENLPFEKRQPRKIILKPQAKPGRYGKKPDERSVEELLEAGFIVLDKPPGPSSHQAAAYAKSLLGVRKAGHSGTLDPPVSGVLVIALNRAAKLNQLLLHSGKEYVGLLHLHGDVPDEDLERTIRERFTGVITQTPPVRSAVRRRPRKRHVYYFTILEREGRDVLVKTGVEAGTYIRKLFHDLGEALGVGAHMQELRRTKAGPFNEWESYTLHDIAAAVEAWKAGDPSLLQQVLKPVEAGVKHIPKVWVADSAVWSITHGGYVTLPGIVAYEDDIEKGGYVAVLTLKDELISYGRVLLPPRLWREQQRGIAVSTDAVIMPPDTYPRGL